MLALPDLSLSASVILSALLIEELDGVEWMRCDVLSWIPTFVPSTLLSAEIGSLASEDDPKYCQKSLKCDKTLDLGSSEWLLLAVLAQAAGVTLATG